jgi:CheY-like chemotaxis protein
MMMPNMDGFMKDCCVIGQNAKLKNLLQYRNCKAMTGDEMHQTGASDYITKPVDIDQLLSLLRVWL